MFDVVTELFKFRPVIKKLNFEFHPFLETKCFSINRTLRKVQFEIYNYNITSSTLSKFKTILDKEQLLNDGKIIVEEICPSFLWY